MRYEGKQNEFDLLKEEEIAPKVAAIKAKRQEVKNDEKFSLKQKQLDKIATKNAHSDTETSIQQKEIKDTKKLYGEKAMSQVIIILKMFKFYII